MRASHEYLEDLLAMRRNVYINGKLVARDHPALKPGIKVISKTFELAARKEWRGLITARSHLLGEEVNRFTHVNQSVDDLLKKQKMIRLACQRCGGCIQRCMGCDAINALSVVTYEIDEKYGTDYYERFIDYLRYFQRRDLVAACAQTDAKGDRSLRPGEQHDPDLYVRVVEKRSSGIVVRGAKFHITTAPYADEIIVVPTRALREKEGKWAVAFAVPADADGVKLITTPWYHRERARLKAPFAEYGTAHSVVVFDDVLVPWDRVFMCGEWDFAGRAAWLFGATYHRHSYTGCKAAVTDMMMGAAALVAEYNGILGKTHVRDKIAELIAIAELIYAAGVAAAIYGEKHQSGTYIPNVVYANAGRLLAGTNIYREYEIVADLAGGLPATLPSEEDYLSSEVGGQLRKYIARKAGVPSDSIYRCFRFLQELICSGYGASKQVSGVHGGGSPVMERIVMFSSYNIEEKKRIAEYLAGILPEQELDSGEVATEV